MSIKHITPSLVVIIFFFIVLFIARVVDNNILGSWQSQHIPEGALSSWLWAIIKASYWCLPIIVILALRGRLRSYLGAKFSVSLRHSWLLLIIPLWAVLALINPSNGPPDLSYHHLINAVLATPFIEEFVFRGFILDGLMRIYSFHRANLIQAILFALIHLPYFYAIGQFDHPTAMLAHLASIAVLGLVCGYLAKRTQSLLPAVVLHATNNLLV